jgi:Ca2+-binding EF-hand superfamily protein
LVEISAAGWVQVGRIDRKEINKEEVQALFNMVDTDKSGFLTKKVKT